MPWDFLQHFSCSAELERMDMAEVERATQADIDRCVATVVLAFSGDPAARWMYADAGMFFANFPRFVRAFGGNAFAHGSAHHIAGSAAALWLPPEVGPDEEQLMALIEGSVAPDRRAGRVRGHRGDGCLSPGGTALVLAADRHRPGAAEPRLWFGAVAARLWRSATRRCCRPIWKPPARAMCRSISGTALKLSAPSR